jgi:hypothetical protein
MDRICAQCLCDVAEGSGFTTPQGHLLCSSCYVTLWRPDTPPRPAESQRQESHAELRQAEL